MQMNWYMEKTIKKLEDKAKREGNSKLGKSIKGKLKIIKNNKTVNK